MAAESYFGDTERSPGRKLKQCVLFLSFSMKGGRLDGRVYENNTVTPDKSFWKLRGGNPVSLPRRMKLAE